MLFRMAYSELTFDLASRESIVLSCFPDKHRSIGLIDRRACPARYVQAHTFRCGESTVRQCSEAAPMVVVSSWNRGLRLLVIRTFDRARHVNIKHRRPYTDLSSITILLYLLLRQVPVRPCRHRQLDPGEVIHSYFFPSFYPTCWIASA